MKKRGQASGPFQLFIGVVVFGMALVIGGYLFNMVNCWKCNELLKSESVDLREALASIGKSDTNTQRSLLVDLTNLGGCAKGIYLRQVKVNEGLSCRTTCPNHPNSCWVIITESTCGNEDLSIDCIDINGDTVIQIEPDFGELGMITSPDQPWIYNAYAITHTVSVKIKKTGPSEITIGKPG